MFIKKLMISFLCLFLYSFKAEAMKRTFMAFDNGINQKISLHLSEVRADISSDLGDKRVEFTSGSVVSSAIQIDPLTLEMYSLSFASGEDFSDKKLFDINSETGELLGSIRKNAEGEFILSDQSGKAMLGLYRSVSGRYQLIIASGIKVFSEKVSELLKGISGMPQQWSQCK